MNRTRIITYLTIIVLSVGITALVGSPYVSLNFVDAQSYGSSDDDDDGDDDPPVTTTGTNSIFTDGRVNDDITAPTAVFCDSGALTFYSAIGRGNAVVTRAELIAGAAQAIATGQSVTLLDSAVARLDASPNRTLTMYSARPGTTNVYQITFALDQCGAISVSVNVSVEELSEEDTSQTQSLESGSTYTIQRGDTLFSIARASGVTVDALIEANNIEDPDRIIAGTTLVIP